MGRPVKGIDARIITIDDDPIAEWADATLQAEGDIGEIAVRGDIVTRGYYQRPQQDALSKIKDGDGFWHRMGDLGWMDHKGRIWFCGRKAHRVVLPNKTLFTIPCEAIFNQHPAVFRSALVGLGTAPHQKPVICIELESGQKGIKTGLAVPGASGAGQFQCAHRRYRYVSHPPRLSGGYPPQLEDLSRKADGLGRQEVTARLHPRIHVMAPSRHPPHTGHRRRRFSGIRHRSHCSLNRATRCGVFRAGSIPNWTSWGSIRSGGTSTIPMLWKRLAGGFATVFHVAAKAGVWGRYADFYRSNVVGTQNVIDACQKYGVSRLIHTSTPSVIFDGRDMQGVDESAPYPDSFHHHYPRTKAVAEQAVVRAAAKGLATIILRPHLIWGPGDPHIIPGILSRAHRLRQIGDGNNLVDTIYIDNAAEAHLLAHEGPWFRNPDLSGRAYFISQGEPIPVWQMINAILEADGKPPIRKRISPAAAYAAGAVLEMIYGILRLKGEPPMTRWGARELATSHWFNIDAARNDLDYTPKVSTREGLERLKRWLQQKS